jgi:outer membrane cobalamin receptor
MAAFLLSEEFLGNLLAARTWESGDWLVEPSVSAIWASRFGVLPQASLGLRRTLTGTLRAFGRASLSRNVPSLQNRYYSYPGLTVPNPGLAPELDYTLSVGLESATEGLRHVFEIFGQWRERAQVPVAVPGGTQTVNAGAAFVTSVTDTVLMDLGSRWVLSQSASLATSRVEQTGRRFQYLPDFVGVLNLATSSNAEREGGKPVWKGEVSGRFSTSAETATAGREVAGYATLDAGIQYQLTAAVQLLWRVENLLDRRYETFADYPNVGRTLFLRIAGEF